ncbi:hypothetical protein D3C72_1687340 [compost metagenome]
MQVDERPVRCEFGQTLSHEFLGEGKRRVGDDDVELAAKVPVQVVTAMADLGPLLLIIWQWDGIIDVPLSAAGFHKGVALAELNVAHQCDNCADWSWVELALDGVAGRAAHASSPITESSSSRSAGQLVTTSCTWMYSSPE